MVSTLTVATKDEVANAVEMALTPGWFFLAPGCRLRVSHEPREEIPWELFAGHLLDETKTRLRKSFESWNIHFDDSVAPVISVRYDLSWSSETCAGRSLSNPLWVLMLHCSPRLIVKHLGKHHGHRRCANNPASQVVETPYSFRNAPCHISSAVCRGLYAELGGG